VTGILQHDTANPCIWWLELLTPLMGVLLHNEYNKLTRYTDAWTCKHISYLFLSHYFVLKICTEIFAPLCWCRVCT